jgi:SAM-dependent methyltransferase
VKLKKKNFNIKNNIYDFNITDPITHKVKKFYEEFPFPNYKINDDKRSILEEGNKNIFLKKLKNFIGFNKLLIEVGSGTCQLSNYLAIGTNNQVCAFDTSLKSLTLGKDFADKNDVKNIKFIRGDIFDEIFEKESFDFVLCNGVLHHTKNPPKAFSNIASYLKKDGYILVGLYNRIGRIRTILRKYIFKIFGKKLLLKLDPVLRKFKNESDDKIQAWIRDQYLHPLESVHTFDEVLEWFELNNIEFINSVPECSLFGGGPVTKLFEKSTKATLLERLLQQFLMLTNRFGSEGGLFIFIGKKIK